MSALRRLERGGYAFELTPGGNIAFIYAWPDEPPAVWADPLLALLREERDAAKAILRAREAWLAAYDEWSVVLEQGGDDPLRDEMYWRQLVMLATQAEWPCYDGAGNDLGAAGWHRLMEQQIQQLKPEKKNPQMTQISQIEERGREIGAVSTLPISSKSVASVKSVDSLPFKPEEKQTMGIKIEQTTYDVVPTGEYRAVISEITAPEGKFGPQLQIKGTINAGPYAGNTFLCWVSTKFSPKSKLYEWVEAALGTVSKSYVFDSDDLIGKEVTATLVVRELDGGGEVNRVDRVKGI